jgi:diaminopropionate ammonia-lyase
MDSVSTQPELVANLARRSVIVRESPLRPGDPFDERRSSGGSSMSMTPRDFHRRLPGYRRTPLLSVPVLAEQLGLDELLVKCESERFGLPSFKMLGASWASYRALSAHLGAEPGPWNDIDELAKILASAGPLTLVAATDGNHGRAVARMARLVGLGARIFVPSGTAPARIEAIRAEGAELIEVDGDYDDAVARSAQEAGPRCLVVSDTSWPGYTEVPEWVIEGYSTMFQEIDEALSEGGIAAPDTVVVPVGVGALAAAAVTHFRSGGPTGRPSVDLTMIGVEPSDAACVAASIRQGSPVSVPGPHRSIMAGLNCGTPSVVAWPKVSAGLDAMVVIGDDWARGAVRDLAVAGVCAGETGAAALGGLRAIRSAGMSDALGAPLGTRALVLVTESVTDPVEWRRTLGVEVVGLADGQLQPA